MYRIKQINEFETTFISGVGFEVMFATCFKLIPCLAYSSTLKMEATCSSETSVNFRHTTWHYIPEYGTLHDLYFRSWFYILIEWLGCYSGIVRFQERTFRQQSLWCFHVILLHSEWNYVYLYKKSYPCNRPWRPIGVWEVEAPTSSRQSAHRWR
jgi:hypothetical protein